jgi:hypothetical protein
LALLAVCVFALGYGTATAQDTASQLVEISWQKSTVLPVPGVTGVVILDEQVSRAEVSAGKIEFFGVSRGETVAFIWADGERISLRVRVVAPAFKLPALRSKGNELEALGAGVIGSSLQSSIGPTGNANWFQLHHLDWQQQSDGKRIAVRGQVQNSNVAGAPEFNVNTASVTYETPSMKLSLMDYLLELHSNADARMSPYSAYNVQMLRGANLMLRRGAYQMEFFGGATIPSHYLTLRGTRDAAGFSIKHRAGDRIYTYATTGWVSSPFTASDSSVQRQNGIFQTVGFAYKPAAKWTVEGLGGASTRGQMAEGTVSYAGEAFTTFLTGTRSSPSFPLNALQLTVTGSSSVTTGATARLNSRITGSTYFQHSATPLATFLLAQGASDYFNSNLSLALSDRHAITLNHAYTNNRSLLTLTGQNQRLDLGVHSRVAGRVSNSIQLTLDKLNDPSLLNSSAQFSVRESLSVPIPTGSITAGVQHTRRDPSLVRRLRDQMDVLTPTLQELFLLNPAAFVQSSDLPPDVRSLLEHLQLSDTEASISAQFHVGKRLNVNANAGYIRNIQGLNRNSNTRLLGYSMSYQMLPDVQLVSSVSNVFLFNPQHAQFERTTVMTIGFNKRFGGVPRWLVPFHSQKGTIRGRVFRDLNLNGTFNSEEPGLSGVQVEIENEHKTAVTDAEGRFEFSGVNPGSHQVRLLLGEHAGSFRLTGPAEVRTELLEQKMAEVYFGVVNFSRLMGNVFNDHLLDGERQPDANGLRSVALKLRGNEGVRTLMTDGAGDYVVNDIAPGDYELSVDRSTLPENFVGPEEPFRFHVAPVTTLVHDIPIRAIRSISGHVYYSDSSKPLAGVQLQIGQTVVTTDADGSFVLRNLPSGPTMLSTVAARPLPVGLATPAGKTTLPREPIQVTNVTIVISNPELLPYLLPANIEH